jgi:DNA polymerase III epsilon subunit-like protein
MILTVLDTETTGLDSDIHEIIQIATISYVVSAEGDRYVTRKYEKKINPERLHTASEKALEVNGFTLEEWKGSPNAIEVIPEVKDIIEKSDILIGQNLIFDLNFINEVCHRNDIEPPTFPPYIDTKSIADRLVRAHWLQRSGMDYLVEHYKVQVEGRAHTALVDCERTMLVFDELMRDVNEEYELFTFENPYKRLRRR